MSDQCRGNCMEQCRCECYVLIHHPKCESEREDPAEEEEDKICVCWQYNCECFDNCECVFWPLDKDKKICTCGHRDHNGYCPSTCCRPIPCPVCSVLLPQWVLDCNFQLCMNCAVQGYSSR